MRSIFLFIAMMSLGMTSYSCAYDGYRAKGISWDRDVTIIDFDNKVMTGAEFCEEFVTSYEYNPKTRQFVEHKCRQDRLAEKRYRLEKRHHHHNEGPNERSRKRRSAAVWLKCDECGKICKGWSEADWHVDATGHIKFHRITF